MVKFNAPIDEYGNPYWVPVVAKNRDWLVAFLYGYHSSSEQINEAMTMSDIGLNIDIVDYPLNSYRYNNILKNGQDASKLSEVEYKNYINTVNDEILLRVQEQHSENKIPVSFFKIDCSCGLGFYNFETEKDIPENNLKCANCGRFVILYTNTNECDFELPTLQYEK